MGLIQGQIERAGIPTVSTSVVGYVTRHMRVPRAAFVRFPIGNPLGQAGNADEQRRVLGAVLDVFEVIDEPGVTVDLPFRWRKPSPHMIDPSVTDLSEPYVIAKEQMQIVADRYEALVEVCHDYRTRLEEALRRLETDPAAEPKEVVLTQMHLMYLGDLLSLLEQPVHDQILVNSSRYFLLQLAHEGKFR